MRVNSEVIQLGQRVLTLREVIAKTCLGKSSIYDLIKSGEFPAPLKLTVRKSGWLEIEIDQWLEDKRAERDRNAPR